MKFDEIQKLIGLTAPNIEASQLILQKHLISLGIDPVNLYQELEMSSDYINTHRDVSYSNATISLHSHDYYEIIYCRQSSDVEYLVGSHRYRLQKGDIVCVPPRVSHRPLLPEHMTDPYIRDVLWIDTGFWDNLKKTLPENSLPGQKHQAPLRTLGTRWEYLGDLFQTGVIEEKEKHPGWEAAVIGNTLLILTGMRRASIEPHFHSIKAEKPELIDQITAYIENHYSQHITIHDLAHHFYVSESTISHLFKQKMGVSLYRYISQRRLITAKNLIHQGKPLEQVGHAVGFTDYSTFYRAFKQEFGISPKQFKQL